MPSLAREIAALPGSTATVEDVQTKLEAISGRIVFPKGLTAATREAGGEPLVTGRPRPFDESTVSAPWSLFGMSASFTDAAVVES